MLAKVRNRRGVIRHARSVTGESGNSGTAAMKLLRSAMLSFDRNAMSQFFYRIGRLLSGKEPAKRLKEDCAWFVAGA
jgi:hypothetical protein